MKVGLGGDAWAGGMTDTVLAVNDASFQVLRAQRSATQDVPQHVMNK